MEQANWTCNSQYWGLLAWKISVLWSPALPICKAGWKCQIPAPLGGNAQLMTEGNWLINTSPHLFLKRSTVSPSPHMGLHSSCTQMVNVQFISNLPFPVLLPYQCFPRSFFNEMHTNNSYFRICFHESPTWARYTFWFGYMLMCFF